MPFLKTTCEFCGEIELPVARVLLRIDRANSTTCCVVRCPDCGHRFVKEANEAMVVMLLAVGIEVSVWSAEHGDEPAIPESGQEPGGEAAPLSHADLVEFRRKLTAEQNLLRHLASQ